MTAPRTERALPAGAGPASMLFWLLLGTGAMLVGALDARVGPMVAQFGIGALALVYGLVVFWRHGGRQVSAAGLYSLASAVFVGAAGIYWAVVDGGHVEPGLHLATALGFATNVLMDGLLWRRTAAGPLPQRPPPSAPAATRWGIGVGTAVTAVALGAHLAGASLGATFLGEIIFGAMSLLIVSTLVHPGKATSVLRLGAAAGVGALYATTVFTGYGRLLLIALGLVAVVPLSLRVRGRLVKAATILMIGPALVALAYSREQFGLQTYGATLDGTGSVTSPLSDLGKLLALHDAGLLALGWGSTLLVSAVFFVPRVLWPDKPAGFGAVLTQILEPQLVAIGQSLTAHLVGEWFYDFGYPGVAVMVVVMGWAIGRLDRYASARIAHPVDSKRDLILLTAVVVAFAGLPDLEWAGTFTYWSRTASRLAVLGVLLLVGGRSRQAGELGPERGDPQPRVERMDRGQPAVDAVDRAGPHLHAE